ncbi:MAG: hypothetical protein L3K13_06355 [Thermoplasmata archaeon]|nr:hypothetical protein [Thermoplasmata archaeon]
MAELRAVSPSTQYGWSRTLIFAGLVVLLFVVGSFALPLQSHLSTSAGNAPHASPVLLGKTPGPLVTVHPAFGNPVIGSFTATPNPVLEGQSTLLTAFASGGSGNLTYTYSRLPGGCATANTTALSCTPTVNGTFVVRLNVTDINGNFSIANLTLYIEPFTTGLFWSHNSTFADLPHASQVCQTANSSPFFVVSCYSQAQNPSLLSLANGKFAVAYGQYTQSTTNTCPGAAAATNARIGWSVSSDGGHTFPTFASLGNTSCAYLNAIEPSFAVSGTTVYGTFIEENASVATLPANYGLRTGDALGFITGPSNGASWTPVKSLVSTGSLARPAMATDGNAIYIVYEDIANSSSTIAGGWLPISVHFIASVDGGVTWSLPVTLPGLNATAQYDALSPSITVNSTGAVTVVYATNRSCVDPAGKLVCDAYGDNIYSITSLNNGTTWSALHLVAAGIGESTCYSAGCLPSYYQSTPETAVTSDATGGLYVLYAGTFNDHSFNPTNNYRWTGTFYAVSLNGGTSWTTMTVQAAGFGNSANFFNPGIGIHGSNVVITYSSDNETLGTGVTDSTLGQWVTSTQTGLGHELSPAVISSLVQMPYGRLTNFTRSSFVGFTSAVGFNATGWPLLVYSLAQTPTKTVSQGRGYYYTNTTYGTNLTFAYRSLSTNYAQTVNITFSESGLPVNVSWEFTLDGQTFILANQSLTIRNVPMGVPVVFTGILAPHGWQQGTLTQSLASPQVFHSAATIVFTFKLSYGQLWYFAPGVLPTPGSKSTSYYFSYFEYYVYDYPYYYIADEIEYYGGPTYSYAYIYEDYYNYTTNQGSYYYCGGSGISVPSYCSPLYFTSGFKFPIQFYTSNLGVPSYTNGTGLGAISGGVYCVYSFECSSANWYGYTHGNVTILSPGNQTFWVGAAGSSEFNESAVPLGLPATTPYHFTWAGKSYTSMSPNATRIANQTLGVYTVSNIWANGSSAGWEYFGHLDNYLSYVLVPWTPVVNLSFSAYENLAAPTQVVKIVAVNLSAGIPWTATFNGTTYGASVPWINVTVHPGTYPFGAGNAVAPNGSAGFVPVGVPSSVSITGTTTTIDVSYQASYFVSASAALGGTFSVGAGSPVSSYSNWVIPGTAISFTAHTDPGFVFLGWTGTGTGSYSGNGTVASVTVNGPVTEAASFEALPGARFNLSFQENGLPAGTEWGVQLNGVGYSTSSSVLTVGNLYGYTSGASGLYHLGVPPAYLNSSSQVRYIAESPPATVTTNGSSTPPVNLVFSPQAAITVTSTVGGFASASSGGAPSTEIWASNGSLVQLAESTSNGYTFTSWTGTGTGSYTGTAGNPTFTSSGSPVTELATFTKNPAPAILHYSVYLNLTAPLANGTTWSVVLNGVGYSSATSSIVVGGLLGSSDYSLVVNTAYSVDGLTQYTGLNTNPTKVHVATQNTPVPIGYATNYWVSISASTGGTATPLSGWYPAGKTVALQAIPTGTEQFSKWVGTGPQSYSGTDASATITVNGPITEVAEFVTPTHATSTTVTSLWQNIGVIGGLAIAGLIVGLLVGLALFRRRGGSPPEESSAPPAAADGGEEMGSESGDQGMPPAEGT